MVEAAAARARLAELEHHLATFPDSVVPVSYALAGPPPLAPLGTLLAADPSPVLTRFASRLKAARPDLGDVALLEVLVPVSAGDQEVYLARLGKWGFEKRMLERRLRELRAALEREHAGALSE